MEASQSAQGQSRPRAAGSLDDSTPSKRYKPSQEALPEQEEVHTAAAETTKAPKNQQSDASKSVSPQTDLSPAKPSVGDSEKKTQRISIGKCALAHLATLDSYFAVCCENARDGSRECQGTDNASGARYCGSCGRSEGSNDQSR